MVMDFGLDFHVDERELEQLITKGVAAEAQDALRRLTPAIVTRTQELVAAAIKSSPEWRSLLTVGSGDNVTLREHFGLANPEPVLERIVKAMQDGVRVDITPPSGNRLAGLVVRILPGDYAAILSVEGAEYVSQGRFRRSRIGRRVFTPNDSHPMTYVIPWLRWLLLEGSGIILAETEINTKATSRASSRTGRAIMVHPTRRAPEGWRVPTEFAGTAEDNWLTRALRDGRVGEEIIEIIQRTLTTM